MINWLLVPSNAALLNWVGFFVGILGLVVTFAGLGIAIKQLSAIKSETEATKIAVNSVQIKIEGFDVVKQCDEASKLIALIRQCLRDKDLINLILNYEILTDIFTSLAHAHSVIEEEDRKKLSNFADDMAKICEGIRRTIENPERQKLKGQDLAIRRFSDVIVKINFHVKKDLRR